MSKITIYGKPVCGFCTQAVDLCDSKQLDYTYLSIGTDIELPDLIDKVVKTGNPAPRTVPVIFIDDEFIGGFQELRARFQ